MQLLINMLQWKNSLLYIYESEEHPTSEQSFLDHKKCGKQADCALWYALVETHVQQWIVR